MVKCPRALRETVGSQVHHRTSTYLNHRLEQDHRGIKQQCAPLRGFGTVEAAAHFCCAFDKLRNDLRPRRTLGEVLPLLDNAKLFSRALPLS